MPHYIKKLTNLQNAGAVIDIFIFPPAQVINTHTQAKEHIPNKPCVGMIDTGASISAIDFSISKELNLISRDFIPVLTPSGTSNHYTYDVGLMLPKEMGYKMYFIEVTECDFSKQSFDVLIGRDVLQYCTLIFNGWDNSFQLHL